MEKLQSLISNTFGMDVSLKAYQRIWQELMGGVKGFYNKQKSLEEFFYEQSSLGNELGYKYKQMYKGFNQDVTELISYFLSHPKWGGVKGSMAFFILTSSMLFLYHLFLTLLVTETLDSSMMEDNVFSLSNTKLTGLCKKVTSYKS